MVSIIGLLIALYTFPRFFEMWDGAKSGWIKFCCVVGIILTPLLVFILLVGGSQVR